MNCAHCGIQAEHRIWLAGTGYLCKLCTDLFLIPANNDWMRKQHVEHCMEMNRVKRLKSGADYLD